MKKLITWFTKFSKIVAIVEYIYRGILVAKDVVELVKKEILEIKPDFRYADALDVTIDYLGKAAEAVAMILRWLGGNVDAVAESVRAQLAANEAKGPVEDLSKITAELGDCVQANK